MKEKIVLKTEFSDLKLHARGKVRDVYDLGENYLIVSTDRLSAFDVVMEQGIPFKGIILTQISVFWFNLFSDLVENHLVATDVNDFPLVCKKYSEDLKDRSMLVKKAIVIPVECIARGYISGSGWEEYNDKKSICGISLPKGLTESSKLEEPIFTPSTKAKIGLHDENISHEETIKIIGEEKFYFLKNKTLEIYKKASEYALQKGIIIADTKMEFGLFNDQVILIDELLTPDSSRFWPKEEYKPGEAQKSFDKQYIRDYLKSINFNKKPPAPNLPIEVIKNTSKKYLEALNILTGKTI